MKITVIVPVYNRAETLALAIRSLLVHVDEVDLDILIVDDGSTDDTSSVIRSFTERYPQIRSVWRENGGVTHARNTGLANLLEETQVVTFLDSDDAMARDRFAGDLPILQENPDIDVIYGNMIATTAIDPTTLAPPIDAYTKEVTSIHLSSMLMRRSVVDRIGRFDPVLQQAEDTDYILRIFETGTKFRQTKTICHYYLRHADGMTQQTDAAKKYFAIAILKSAQRRKADPTRQLNKPSFEIRLPPELM